MNGCPIVHETIRHALSLRNTRQALKGITLDMQQDTIMGLLGRTLNNLPFQVCTNENHSKEPRRSDEVLFEAARAFEFRTQVLVL